MSQHDPGDETDLVAGFPRAAHSFTDQEGRTIEVRASWPRAALAEMYDDFDPASRSQGLPPVGRERIEEWLDLLEEGVNVVAWHRRSEAAVQPPSDEGPAVQPPSDDGEPAVPDERGTAAGQTGPEIAVGHACLLDCEDGTSELTIFVHQDYQLAGIGSRLIRTLLAQGQESGVERVWLTVERSNHVAMNLYRSVGFETTNAAGVEHEMELEM